MFLKLPQDYIKGGHRRECRGDEKWVGDYFYPNGWTLSTFKTIAFRESTSLETNYGASSFPLLFILFFFAFFNYFAA